MKETFCYLSVDFQEKSSPKNEVIRRRSTTLVCHRLDGMPSEALPSDGEISMLMWSERQGWEDKCKQQQHKPRSEAKQALILRGPFIIWSTHHDAANLMRIITFPCRALEKKTAAPSRSRGTLEMTTRRCQNGVCSSTRLKHLKTYWILIIA